MNCLKKIMVAGAFFALTGTAVAAPAHLVTINDTNHGKVYAKIGNYKSGDPVLPKSTRNRPWSQVKVLCRIQKMPKDCKAEIIVTHDLSGQSESLGFMSMDIDTGVLSDKEAHPSAHYSMSIAGNAQVKVVSISNDF